MVINREENYLARPGSSWYNDDEEFYHIPQLNIDASNADEWEEVDDGVESEGETTTFTDEVPEDSKKMFWRITDMGPAEQVDSLLKINNQL